MNRTVTVTPAAGQTGSTYITINAADGTDSVSKIVLLITVNAATVLPTISSLSDQLTAEKYGDTTVLVRGGRS